MNSETIGTRPCEGEYYEAEAPDTLDLAQRAEYAIHALTGTIREDFEYECIWGVRLVPPPSFITPASGLTARRAQSWSSR